MTSCPIPISDYPAVLLAHGGGGRVMRNLIEGLFRPAFAPDDGNTPAPALSSVKRGLVATGDRNSTPPLA